MSLLSVSALLLHIGFCLEKNARYPRVSEYISVSVSVELEVGCVTYLIKQPPFPNFLELTMIPVIVLHWWYLSMNCDI